jgi:hypothetical protein
LLTMSVATSTNCRASLAPALTTKSTVASFRVAEYQFHMRWAPSFLEV